MAQTLSGTLAVVSQGGESLSFYDVSNGERLHRIDNVPAQPHELAYDAKRNLIYMSHTYRGGNYWTPGEFCHQISVVDATSFAIIDTIDTLPAKAPHGMYWDEPRDILYASVEQLPNDEGGLIAIELNTRKVVKTIGSNYRSHWFVVTPDGKKAYTCNKTATFISVLDLERGVLATKIDCPSCEHPGISKDGRYAFFPTPGWAMSDSPDHPPAIKVIDTVTDTIVRSVPVESCMCPLVVSPRGTILAGRRVPKLPSGELPASKLSMWDNETFELIAEVEVGHNPLTMCFSPDGRWAFVANSKCGTVSIVDIDGKRVVRIIENDVRLLADGKFEPGAHGLAFIPSTA